MAALVVPAALMFFVIQAGKKRPRTIPGLGGVATSVAYAPDGTLVCASTNGLVQKWMPEIGKWRSFRPNTRGYSYGRPANHRLKFSHDGKVLYAGGSLNSFGSDGATVAWELASRDFLYELNPTRDRAFDISRDGQIAALGIGDGVAICPIGSSARFVTPKWAGARSGQKWLQHSRFLKLASPADLSLSPDGKLLAVAHGSGSIGLFGTGDGKQMRDLADDGTSRGLNSGVTTHCLAWSPDGKWIAAAHASQVLLWRADGSQAAQVELSPVASSNSAVSGPIRPVTFSPDSSRLAIGGPDVRLFSVPALEPERTLAGAGGVAFSPDGRSLATGHATTHAVLEWHL